jgi:hypothetical protein
MALQSLKDLGRLTYRWFLELFRHTVGLLGWVISRHKASTYTGKHNTERRGQTPMPCVGFEPTIPATNRPRPMPQTAQPLWPAIYPIIIKMLPLWFIYNLFKTSKLCWFTMMTTTYTHITMKTSNPTWPILLVYYLLLITKYLSDKDLKLYISHTGNSILRRIKSPASIGH